MAKTIPDDDTVLRACRACPKFTKQSAGEQCLETAELAEMFADSLSACWARALLALLAIAGALILQDRFEPAPSIEVPSSMWIVLLHLGATITLGVMHVVTKP